MENTKRASAFGRRMRGDSAVPVCTLSDRDIRIQFCLKSLGNALMKRAGLFTFGLAVRYAWMALGVKLLRVGIAGLRSKTGLAARLTAMVSTHVETPVQSGVVFISPSGSRSHPTNTDPAAGEAVSVTVIVLPKVASQVTPQLMPAGLEVIVPEPSPNFITFRSAASLRSIQNKSAARSTIRDVDDAQRWDIPVRIVRLLTCSSL